MTRTRSGPSAAPGRSSLDTTLLLGYGLFVVYGSLVPLDLQRIPLDEAWQRFRTMPFLQLGVESRADWIANGVLYAPLGFLAAWRLLLRTWWSAAAALAAVVLGAALALGVEFAQVFFPPRTVSMNDVMAECIGSVLGALAALAYWRYRRARPSARHRAGPWLTAHSLQLYAAAYLAFCLFPFDVLISLAEIQDKLASDLWGWWIAGQDRRPLLVVLQLAIEAALTAPFGALLGQRAMPRPAPGWARAALFGLALGLAVEGAQLLIASGTTQGASVLSRVLGVVAGLALWRLRDRWSVGVVRGKLAASSIVWLPGYLLLLAAVNGWFTSNWQGPDAAAAKWQELRLLPFYYHYYTTEAHALFSLVSVFLMYLPLGALAWSRGRSARTAAVCGAAASAGVEASKLWLAGLHPDPTNILIAATASWALVRCADAWPSLAVPRGAEAPVAAGATPSNRSAVVRQHPGAARTAVLLALGLAPAALYLATSAPFGAASVALLAACAAAVWARPLAALVIVPFVLPALDLAPWTGRFFWDEFDLLLALSLAIGFVRTPALRPQPAGGLWGVAFALLALSYAVSTFIGAMPWPWPDANSLVSYDSPYNALRIAKAVLWAWLFIGLLRRLANAGHDTRPALAVGMALGLAYVVGFVVWERAAFVGLFDFADEYRVTGPFSAMHRGGAFVECYIAVALPFLAVSVVEARQRWVRLAGAVLLLAASYAMMVTFSRNGYAAFGVALLFMLWLTRSVTGGRQAAFIGMLIVAAVAVAVPVLSGPFARERLANWNSDLGARRSHWDDALAMRDSGLATSAFGMGVGRFVQTHFWRSREPVHAGSYALESAGDTSHLRLGAGAKLYLDQIIHGIQSGPHQLKVRLKANQPAALLEMSVCEKWMLTSRACVGASVKAAEVAGTWSDVETSMDLSPLAGSRGRTVKFSLHTPTADTVVDVARVGLLAPGGRDLLVNGDFARGLDRWFFSTDVDPPWHVHSLPVSVLFEQGWFGVVAWTVLIGTALVVGIRHARAGDRHAAAALAALLAFLVSGSLNTLIDEPRFLFLLLLLTALAGRRESAHKSTPS